MLGAGERLRRVLILTRIGVRLLVFALTGQIAFGLLLLVLELRIVVRPGDEGRLLLRFLVVPVRSLPAVSHEITRYPMIHRRKP
ncbi:hypothetical protein HDA40_001722 [Hamadaea flava]|uniref:Secreted protein n=1 Tax=Hamadaea flava TaxID=1742688 RepID=A0ABV8LP20_9ACTN|nr:hypothetical protein [Hamadaea flava]MCP2323215.1 hypothetical protein [Hamadaea flava]